MSYLDDLMNESYKQEAQRLYHQQNGNQPQQQVQQQMPQQQIDPTYAFYMGIQQEEAQPQATQQNEGGLFSGFFRGAKSGGAGVIGGQAGLGNLYGVGDGATAQWANDVAQSNARRKEYSIPEMLPFASDYWTNGEGAAYDLGNALGSSAVLGAETAAVMSGVGAVAGALGIGTTGLAGAIAAGSRGAIGMQQATKMVASMGAGQRAAALGQYAVKNVASRMALGAEKAGLHTLSKVLSGPAGQMYALNILRTPFEVSSEMGNAGQDALADGKSIDEARKRAWITGAVQTPLLAFSNTLETGNLGKILMGDAKKLGGTKQLINALGGITMEAFQNAWEEGMQQSSQEYAADKQSLLGVVNPFQWSPEAKAESAAGFVSGLGIGAGGTAMNKLSGGDKKKQTAETPADPQQARDFLTQYAKTDGVDPAVQDAIAGVLETGDDTQVIAAAQNYGWDSASKEQNKASKEEPKAETPEDIVRSALEDTTIDEKKRGYYNNALNRQAEQQAQVDALKKELDGMINAIKEKNPDIKKKALASETKKVKESKEYKDKESNLKKLEEKLKKTTDDIAKMSKRITQHRRSAEIGAMQKTQTEYGDNSSNETPSIIQSTIQERDNFNNEVKTNVPLLTQEERTAKAQDSALGFADGGNANGTVASTTANKNQSNTQPWQAKAQNDAEVNAINNEEKAKAKEDKANKRLKDSMINDAEDGGNAAEWSRKVAEAKKQTPIKTEAGDGQAVNYRDSARIDNKASEKEESPLVVAQRQMRENQEKADKERGAKEDGIPTGLNKKDETVVYDKGYEERKATRQRQEQTAKEADKMQLANDKEQASDTQERQASEQARIDARDKAVAQAKKDKGYYAPRNQAEQDLWSKWDNQIKNGKEPNLDSNKDSAERYKNYSTTYQNSIRDSLAPQNKQEQTTYKRWSDQLKKGKKPTVTANEKALYERFKKYRALKGENNGNNQKNEQQVHSTVQAVSVQNGQPQQSKQAKADNQGKRTNGKTQKVDNNKTEFSIKTDTQKKIDASKVVIFLRKLGYDVRTDQESWDKYGGTAKQQEVGSKDAVKGFAVGDDGVICLNPDGTWADTPIHEFIHLWFKMLEKSNPQLYRKGIELLKQTKTRQAVLADPNYANIHGDEERIASEVLARIGGERGTYRIQDIEKQMAKLGESEGIISKIIKWIGSLFHHTQTKVAPTEDLANMTVWDFVDRPFNDLIGGLTADELKSKKNSKSIENTYSTEDQIKEFQVTSGTYFSGGGLVDYALKSIIDGQFAVELNKQIAGVYEANNGKHMFNMNVEDFKVEDFAGKVDYFHASPCCQNYSGAKAKAKELPVNMTTAKATADALRKLKPKAFTLENVPRYRNSQAMKVITDALDELGYNYDIDIYNAADYGAATSRDRLLLRALRDEPLPAKPKPITKKIGWLSAVEDLIDTLPETNVPNWIQERINKNNIDVKNIKQPVLFLHGTKGGDLVMAEADKPAPTLLASDHDQRIFMPDGRVIKATPQVIARIQGLDDKYKLPSDQKTAYRVVGNGVPIKLTQSVFGPLLKQIDEDGGKNAEFSIGSQAEAVRDRYKGTDKWMKAPNGKPQVFYRGIDGLYDVKKQGDVVWITDSLEQAENYRDNVLSSKSDVGEVLDVYARVENPIDLGDSWDEWSIDDIAEKKLIPAVNKALKDGRITEKQADEIRNDIDNLDSKKFYNYEERPLFEIYNDVPGFVPILKKLGYDAIKVAESGNTTYGVFGKSHVKSATNNNGNYDINNDHIEYSIKKIEENGKIIENTSSTPLQKQKALQETSDLVGGGIEFNIATAKDKESQDYMRKQAIEVHGWNPKMYDAIFKQFMKTVDLIDKNLADKYPNFRKWSDAQIREFNENAFREAEKNGEMFVWVYKSPDGKTIEPVVSAFKTNEEYPHNSDLGTTCTKREGIDKVFKVLVDTGLYKNLSPRRIEELKDVLRKYNILTPCNICFVDTKRYNNLKDACKIAYIWKATMKIAGIDDDENYIGYPRKLTDAQRSRLEKMANAGTGGTKEQNKADLEKVFNELVADGNLSEFTRAEKSFGITSNNARWIAKLFLNDPRLANNFDPTKVLYSGGTTELMTLYDRALEGAEVAFPETTIRGFLGGIFGSANAKPTEQFSFYHSLSFAKDWTEKNLKDLADLKNLVKSVYGEGGFRIQSFSDFNIYQVVDVLQHFFDMALRHLPEHAYTKVDSLIRIFGKTGCMFNMSFVADVEDGSTPQDAGMKRADEGLLKAWKKAADSNGVVANGYIIYNGKPARLVDCNGDAVRFDKDGNRIIPKKLNLYEVDAKGKYLIDDDQSGASAIWTYNWHPDSFDLNKAYEFRKNPEYRGRVGIIGVGLSNLHIRAMLNDPNIDQVIPYHKSSLPPIVSAKTHLDKKHADEYSKYQEPTPLDGCKYSKKNLPKNLVSYNLKLRELRDPRKAAEVYKEDCKRLKCLTKFPIFSNEHNYYKLLADFRNIDHQYDDDGNIAYTLDKNGNVKYVERTVIQGPVKMQENKLQKNADGKYVRNKDGWIRESREKGFTVSYDEIARPLEGGLNYRDKVIDPALASISDKNSDVYKDIVSLMKTKPQDYDSTYVDALDEINGVNNNDVEFSIRNTHTSPGTDADLSSVAGAVSRPNVDTIKGLVEEGKDRVKEAKDTGSLDPLAKGSRFREKWIDKYDTISIFDKAILAAQNELLLKQGKETLKMLPESEQYKNRVTMLTNVVGGMQHCMLDGNAEEMKIAADHYNLPAKNLVTIDGEKHHVSMDMIAEFLNSNKEDLQTFMDACGNENVIQALDTLVSSEGVLEDYENYLEAHNRWERSGKKGDEPTYTFPKGTSKAKFEKVVAKAPKALKEAANMYYKFNNDLLHILRHSGVISEKELKTYENKYKKFCPLMRDFSDSEALDNYIRDVFGGGGVANVSNPLKHRSGKGSSRNILSPVGSTALAVRAYLTRAERNMLAQEIIKSSKDYSLTNLIKPAKQNAKIGPEESVIAVMVNGKKQLYEVERTLYGPLTNCFAPTVRLDIALAQTFAKWLRNGSTTSPSFILRNFFRDTFSAGIMSHYNFIPVWDSIKGMLKLINDKDFRARFYSSGIVNSTQFHSREDVEKRFLELTNGQSKEYGLVDFAKSIIKYSWGKYSGFNELIEACTRAGLMAKAEEAGASPAQAAYEAIYGTVNFNRSGTAGQQVNKVIPFFNACIQGGDLLYQEFRRHPQETATKIMTYIVVPSMVLWAANSDEDWYKELDPNIKMNYWCLPGGLRIQKAEAAVIFGSGSEAAADYVNGKDPKALSHLRKAIKDVFLPNFIPTVALPLIEWQANYSFFREKPVVNKAMQKLPNELQYGPYTPAGAIWAGKAIGQSPDKIYNAWRSIFGTMGAFALQLTDVLDEDKANLPEKHWTEKPIARDFIINNNNLNRTVSDFFELLDAADKQHSGYGVSGKPTKDISEIQKYGRMISKAYAERKKIESNTNLSSTQKRTKTDKIDRDIKRMAKAAVDKYGKKFDIV